MANQKAGLNFYTIDTDRYQDMRIKRLKKSLGGLGVAVYDYILCEIYRVRGYYCEWNDDVAFDVAEYWGIKETLVQEIVKYCGAVGLFNKELLTRGIVTSASIQRRYLEMCARAKRKAPEIPKKLSLISEEYPQTSEECAQNSEECGENSEVCPQSKVKKSKEKISKEKLSLSISPSFEGDESDSAEAERERIFRIFFLKNFQNPAQEVERFYAHYEAQGWKRGKGLPVTDRVALAQSWKPENENAKHFPDKVAEMLLDWYTAGSPELRQMLPYELYGAVIEEQTLYFCLTDTLKDEINRCADSLGSSFKEHFPNYSLRYRVPQVN